MTEKKTLYAFLITLFIASITFIFIHSQVKIKLIGDINDNGRIDSGDVAKLYLIYSGFITDPELVERGDLNGNGKIDLGDVAKLYLIYSGIL